MRSVGSRMATTRTGLIKRGDLYLDTAKLCVGDVEWNAVKEENLRASPGSPDTMASDYEVLIRANRPMIGGK